MSLYKRLVAMRVTTDAFDIRVGQALCFVAAPVLLVVALIGLARLAASPGEVFLGVLGSVTVALLLVVLGIVLPLAHKKHGAK